MAWTLQDGVLMTAEGKVIGDVAVTTSAQVNPPVNRPVEVACEGWPATVTFTIMPASSQRRRRVYLGCGPEYRVIRRD